MRKIIIPIMLFTLAISCSYASRANFNSMGANHKITVYSGGQAVKVWHSKGQVSSNMHSDGCYFEDLETGKFVEVQGACVIEQE